MLHNEIDTFGNIVLGPKPDNFSSVDIKNILELDLNKNDYEFTWKQKKSQPYSGILYDGDNDINLYIYIWNLTPAYRSNDSEKRIQIPATVNNIGINRAITNTEKTIILGIYNSPTGTPIYAAWDPATNINHGQKSCYVQIEDVAKAITNGICRVTDKNGYSIFTIHPDYLAYYVSNLITNNQIPTLNETASLKEQIKKSDEKKHKKRILKSIDNLQKKISLLSATEQSSIIKSRIGQGYFRDMLINKYSCKCALCDITTESMLTASHIKEWSISSDTEKLDINNGLLLCKHHDALFDKHLISFDSTGKLIVSPTLSPSECESLQISSIPNIDPNSEMLPYLSNHLSKLKR